MRRKRQLSSESQDLGPRTPKQCRIEHLFGRSKSQPSTASLESQANSTEVIDYSRLSPHTRALIRDLIDDQERSRPSEGDAPTDRHLLELILQQSSSTAQTVKQILNLLEHLLSVLKGQYLDSSKFYPAHSKPSLTTKFSELQATSSNFQHEVPAFPSFGNSVTKLIYDPKSVAITVFPHSGQFPDWTKKWKTKKYLAKLLRTDLLKINLYRIQRLPSSQQQERVVLHFHSHHVPSLIFSHSREFKDAGVYPHRHFKNLTITKLVPISTEKPRKAVNVFPPTHNTPSGRNSSSSPPLLDLPVISNLPRPLLIPNPDFNDFFSEQLECSLRPSSSFSPPPESLGHKVLKHPSLATSPCDNFEFPDGSLPPLQPPSCPSSVLSPSICAVDSSLQSDALILTDAQTLQISPLIPDSTTIVNNQPNVPLEIPSTTPLGSCILVTPSKLMKKPLVAAKSHTNGCVLHGFSPDVMADDSFH